MVTRGAIEDRRCRDRLDAMLPRLDAEWTQIIADDALEPLLRSIGPREELRRGGLSGRARQKELVALGRLADTDVFPGYSWRELRSGRREARYGVLCQTAVEIQSAVGCPFDCTYCPYTHFISARLDVEHFVDRVSELVRERPTQSVFKLNNRSDTLGLEPAYGLAPALVERFAELEDKYLMLYSKGDAVDGLLDLEHRGRTIACFTLTPEPVAELLETGAPPPAARIAAIAKLARAGYPVRARFSPIVPVRGWREAYRDLVARLARAATPELVTLWTLSMVEADDLAGIVPVEALDEEALAAVRREAHAMRGLKGAPFPPSVRSSLYREIAALVRDASPATHLSLCLESPEVWDAVGSVLVPRRGAAFLCNCGPHATPPALARIGHAGPSGISCPCG